MAQIKLLLILITLLFTGSLGITKLKAELNMTQRITHMPEVISTTLYTTQSYIFASEKPGLVNNLYPYYPEEYMTWIPVFDSLGMTHLYVDCPLDIILDFMGDGDFKLEISDAEELMNYVEILGFSMNGQEKDVSKIKWGDTIVRTATDTVGLLRINLHSLPASMNGLKGNIISSVIDGRSDTIHLSFFDRVEYEYTYLQPAVQFEGLLVLNLIGGSNKLFRSIDNGLTWEFARDTVTNDNRLFTSSQIANLGETFTILLKEPNSCWMDTIAVPSVIRQVIIMPSVAGAVCDVPAGEHYINNMEDFIFRIIPTGSSIGADLTVFTSRTSIPDSEGVIVVKQEDGSYMVTILQIQEPIEIYIDFAISSAIVESHKIWSNADMLYIQTEIFTNIQVYTLSGISVITAGLSEDGITRIQLPKGFYIIKINDRAYKIIIK